MTDEAGETAAERRYYPWGTERYIDAAVPTARLYTGQIKDGTGLYYYNARYYDPYLGRFISPDTIVPGAGNPQNLNRYSYVRNSPVRYADSTGRYIDVDAARQGVLRYMDATGQYVLEDLNQGIFTRLPTDKSTVHLYQGFGNTAFAHSKYQEGSTTYFYTAHLHSGLDLAMPAGDPVYAMSAGVVVGINQDMGGGSLAIQTGDKRVVYGHMTHAGFTEGDKIEVGQKIGTAEYIDDPHLHLEVRDANDLSVFYNPLDFFAPDVVFRITGLDAQRYVNPATGMADSSYNAWSMVSYHRGPWGGTTYGNFWTGTATATWR